MLAKTFRLTRQNFWLVKQTGKSFRTNYFSGYWLENHLSHNRYSVVISTQLIKSAVKRNHWRRLIYQILPTASARPVDMLLYPRPAVLKLTGEELSACLAEVVQIS